jgi:hypothetical protein
MPRQFLVGLASGFQATTAAFAEQRGRVLGRNVAIGLHPRLDSPAGRNPPEVGLLVRSLRPAETQFPLTAFHSRYRKKRDNKA